jgi:fused signal recognition particle receptor
LQKLDSPVKPSNDDVRVEKTSHMTDEQKKGWFSRFKKKKVASPDEPSTPADAPAGTQPLITPEDPAPEAAATAMPHAEITAPDPVPTPEPAPQPEPVAAPIAAPEPEPEPEVTPEPEADTEKAGWFQRLKGGLKKSSSAISGGITGIFTKAKLDDQTLEDLEDLLITSDLGVAVAAKLTAVLAKDRFDKEISSEEVKTILANEIEKILSPVAVPLVLDASKKPHVILMAGVNGAGKTTTIGKLAKKFKDDGKKVMLAAGDTFRAAAVEQLEVWGERTGVPVVTKVLGSDAAALAYEALDRAIAEGMDVLLIDTAGRLQNREELMAELAKVVRVIGNKLEGAPHDTVIVLDASTGQNAVHQVEVFQKLANISGIIMTKLDGSARGGVLVACADKFGLPVHAIGVGEAIEDLQPFNAREFARALVGLED